MATEANPNHAGVNRRRFLLTSGAVGAGTLAAGLSSWPAAGEPGVQGFVPPHGCGDPNDHDKDKDSLWLDVKGTTPMHPGIGNGNIAVVQPDPKKNAYAVHHGGSGKYDLLIIPVTRVTGVECPGLTGDTFLNLWPEAIKEAQKRFSGVDVIAGINSFDGRTKNQLHIHLTAFFNPARQMLDKLTNITSKPDEWNSSIYVLEGSSNPPGGSNVPFAYRILHVNNLDFNLFELLQSKIALVAKNDDMFAQSLAVVTAPKPKGGYYLINTQGNKTQTNQPLHNPDLKVDTKAGKVFGTKTVEGLFYRG